MWDPRSYIAERTGCDAHSCGRTTLPSFYDYTTRLLALQEEEARLLLTVAEERSGWKSVSVVFRDSHYTIRYSIQERSIEFERHLQEVAATIAVSGILQDELFTAFCDSVVQMQADHSSELDHFFDNPHHCGSSVYLRDAFFCSELKKRVLFTSSLSFLLVEGEYIKFLLKGGKCTIPIAALIDARGSPVRFEGVTLEAPRLSCSNGLCKRLSDDSELCFVTVISSDEKKCAVGLRAAEIAVDFKQMEMKLRSLVDARIIACFSCVFCDSTVMQYEISDRECNEPVKVRDRGEGIMAHRARVVRSSENADAMHVLHVEAKKNIPVEVLAFEDALEDLIFVATMNSSSDSFYFEVVRRVLRIEGDAESFILSIECDSPLHNNVLHAGDRIMLFRSSDADKRSNSLAGQWILRSGCSKFETGTDVFGVPKSEEILCAFIFTTIRSIPTGDSVVLIGNASDVSAGPCITSKVRIKSTVKQSVFYHIPFVCRFLHRVHGPVGFVGHSIIFCSTTPLIVAALVPSHLHELITSEVDVDPAVALFFFCSDTDVFSNLKFPEFTNALPCPLHQLSADQKTMVSCEVACRLLQICPLSGFCNTLLLLSLTRVNHDGSRLLRIV